MNSPILGLRVASVIFGLVSLGHLLRMILAIEIYVGGWYIQRRWNLIAFLFCAALCVWLWKLACDLAKPKEAAPPPAA